MVRASRRFVNHAGKSSVSAHRNAGIVPPTFNVEATSENIGKSGIDSVGAMITSRTGTSGITTVGSDVGGSTNVGMTKLGSATSATVGIVGSVITGVLGMLIVGNVMSVGTNVVNANAGASGAVPNDGEYMAPTVTVVFATLVALIATGENVVAGSTKSAGLYTVGSVGLVMVAAGAVTLGAVIAGTVIAVGAVIDGAVIAIGENDPGLDCNTGGCANWLSVGCVPASSPILPSAAAISPIAFSIEDVSKSVATYCVVFAAASASAAVIYCCQ
jgi:hypothetical protein